MKLQNLATRLEIKATEDTGAIEGLGSVFGNVDDAGDIVAPGAFVASIASRPVKMLWQHNPDEPIGVWEDVRETPEGLMVRGQIAVDTQRGRDVLGLLRMGAVNGLSIGFNTRKSTFDDKTGIRTILEAELWEVSIVTFPANEKAVVTSIKAVADIDALSMVEIERILREAGFSRGEAKGLMNRIGAIVSQREAGEQRAKGIESALKKLLSNLKS